MSRLGLSHLGLSQLYIPVVYSIKCLKCQTQYVGETKRQIKKRMYEHLHTINNYGKIQPTPVSEHFNIECKRPACLEFQVLETIRGDPTLEGTTKFRRNREKWWILNLRTLDPAGMNIFKGRPTAPMYSL